MKPRPQPLSRSCDLPRTNLWKAEKLDNIVAKPHEADINRAARRFQHMRGEVAKAERAEKGAHSRHIPTTDANMVVAEDAAIPAFDGIAFCAQLQTSSAWSLKKYVAHAGCPKLGDLFRTVWRHFFINQGAAIDQPIERLVRVTYLERHMVNNAMRTRVGGWIPPQNNPLRAYAALTERAIQRTRRRPGKPEAVDKHSLSRLEIGDCKFRRHSKAPNIGVGSGFLQFPVPPFTRSSNSLCAINFTLCALNERCYDSGRIRNEKLLNLNELILILCAKRRRVGVLP